jgi:hypothetical protein
MRRRVGWIHLYAQEILNLQIMPGTKAPKTQPEPAVDPFEAVVVPDIAE